MTELGQSPVSTREALINEALDQFATHGIAETSIRSICKNLGQSTAAISYHFGSKEGLAAEVIEECLKRLSYAFNWFDENSDFEHTAARFCQHMALHSKEMFVLYRFTFSRDLSFFHKFREHIKNLRQRFCIYFTKAAKDRNLILTEDEYKVRSDTYLQALMQVVLDRSIESQEVQLKMENWNQYILKALLS